MRLTLTLLICFLVSACAVPGGFCDTAKPIKMDRALAEALVTADRQAAEDIAAHNAYGKRVCGWK